MARLSGFFGVLAALLVVVGLHGLLSYFLAQRRSEIGIRIALGASRSRVVAAILRSACAMLAVGLAAGTALALAPVAKPPPCFTGSSPGIRRQSSALPRSWQRSQSWPVSSPHCAPPTSIPWTLSAQINRLRHDEPRNQNVPLPEFSADPKGRRSSPPPHSPRST
jgi:hypothetical protein